MPCFDSKKLKKQRPPEVPKSEWSDKNSSTQQVLKIWWRKRCTSAFAMPSTCGMKWPGMRSTPESGGMIFTVCDFKTWRQGDPKKSTLNFPEIHQRQKEAWSCVDEQNMTQYLWLTLVPCVIEVIYRSCFLNALRVEAFLIVLTFRSKGAPR